MTLVQHLDTSRGRIADALLAQRGVLRSTAELFGDDALILVVHAESKQRALRAFRALAADYDLRLGVPWRATEPRPDDREYSYGVVARLNGGTLVDPAAALDDAVLALVTDDASYGVVITYDELIKRLELPRTKFERLPFTRTDAITASLARLVARGVLRRGDDEIALADLNEREDEKDEENRDHTLVTVVSLISRMTDDVTTFVYVGKVSDVEALRRTIEDLDTTSEALMNAYVIRFSTSEVSR